MRVLENLKVERDGPIAVVSINRPATLNALSRTTLDEIRGIVGDLNLDSTTGAIVLTGADTGKKPSFAAGADISELAQMDMLGARAHAKLGQAACQAVEDSAVPVIAAVNGFALGGGCELALACHVRIASENARLGTPEVKLGIMCGYAGTQRLPRLLGKGRALELLLSGEMVDAQEALRIGLVNRVVPKQRLLEECEALLRKMLANGPVSLRFTLEAVNAGLELPLAQAQYLEATLFGLICTTEDMKEGTRAFLEKRTAKFEGR